MKQGHINALLVCLFWSFLSPKFVYTSDYTHQPNNRHSIGRINVWLLESIQNNDSFT